MLEVQLKNKIKMELLTQNAHKFQLVCRLLCRHQSPTESPYQVYATEVHLRLNLGLCLHTHTHKQCLCRCEPNGSSTAGEQFSLPVAGDHKGMIFCAAWCDFSTCTLNELDIIMNLQKFDWLVTWLFNASVSTAFGYLLTPDGKILWGLPLHRFFWVQATP